MMQKKSRAHQLNNRKGHLLPLVTVVILLLSACNVDPSQLAGTALGDSIFLPIINNTGSDTTQNDTTQPDTAQPDTPQPDTPQPDAAQPDAAQPDAAQPDAAQSGDIIPGEYIVVLSDELVMASGVTAIAAEMTAQYGGEVTDSYSAALSGFAATFPPAIGEEAAAALQQDPRVAYVVPNRVIKLDPGEAVTDTVAEGTTTAVSNEVSASAVEAVQTGATWGLDRIDQRALPLDNSYTYGSTGISVQVYILDTGIRVTHSDFGGRATWGTNTVDTNDTDCQGHGTHVAGTVGGTQYGVAKGVKLIAVKVLDCTGYGESASVISGVDWVTAQKQLNPSIPMVANMSLAGFNEAAMNQAVRNSIAAGVVYVLAAGNGNLNACQFSPAGTTEGITVGATTNSDKRDFYSNWGTCVDLFAPGSNITSAGHTDDTSTDRLSGTSMAAPHVAGAAARYLQSNPTATPQHVRDALVNSATPNVVNDPAAGSPNLLLYLDPAKQWLKIPVGRLSTVSVGSDGTVWGVNRNSEIYQWNGSDWAKVDGLLNQIAVGSASHVWGVNNANHIFRRDGNTWTRIKNGLLKQVDVGCDGTVWGVNNANQSFRWDGVRWIYIGENMTQIAVGNATTIWGIGLNSEIFRWNGAAWAKYSKGLLKQVDAGCDGTVWGTNNADEVYQWDGAAWIKQPITLNQISVGSGTQLWGVNDAGEIFTRQ